MRRTSAVTRSRVSLVVVVAVLAVAGCHGPAPEEATKPDLSASSGLMLPPGFKVVDLPVDKRQDIFREAQRIRALAVREANGKLPMDEAHLPIGDTPAFDKRVADHKAIIEEILKKNLDELAKKNDITREELDRIEDEARKLRWTPPEEPSGNAVAAYAKSPEGPKPTPEDSKEKPPKGPKPSKDDAK